MELHRIAFIGGSALQYFVLLLGVRLVAAFSFFGLRNNKKSSSLSHVRREWIDGLMDGLMN